LTEERQLTSKRSDYTLKPYEKTETDFVGRGGAGCRMPVLRRFDTGSSPTAAEREFRAVANQLRGIESQGAGH
jgi:hypothetical protein